MGVVNRPCYLSEVDSIYQLKDLDYPYIAGIAESTIPKLDLRFGAEWVRGSASALHEHCFVSAEVSVSIEKKQVLVFQSYSNCTSFFFENYGIGIILL